MKQLFLLIILLISTEITAQTIPIVSEPVVNALYRYYPNLVQLRLSNDDYNDYILVNDSCEVLLTDKTGGRLASNNFIINIPYDFREDSVHFRLFNRSDMQRQIAVVSFDLTNPPLEVIYLDGVAEGGKMSKRPKKMEAITPEEAPIRLIHEVEYWTMEIGEKEVFGKDGKFDEYAYSVLNEYPSGTKVKFRVRVLQEKEYSSFREVTYYLE